MWLWLLVMSCPLWAATHSCSVRWCMQWQQQQERCESKDANFMVISGDAATHQKSCLKRSQAGLFFVTSPLVTCSGSTCQMSPCLAVPYTKNATTEADTYIDYIQRLHTTAKLSSKVKSPHRVLAYTTTATSPTAANCLLVCSSRPTKGGIDRCRAITLVYLQVHADGRDSSGMLFAALLVEGQISCDLTGVSDLDLSEDGQ